MKKAKCGFCSLEIMDFNLKSCCLKTHKKGKRGKYIIFKCKQWIPSHNEKMVVTVIIDECGGISPIWSMTQEQNIQLHHQHILKKRTSMFQLKRGMIYVKAGLEVLNMSRKNEFKSTYMLASDIELIKATLKM